MIRSKNKNLKNKRRHNFLAAALPGVLALATEQVTDRTKAKVMACLGEGTNLHDRYFIIPFAYRWRRKA